MLLAAPFSFFVDLSLYLFVGERVQCEMEQFVRVLLASGSRWRDLRDIDS